MEERPWSEFNRFRGSIAPASLKPQGYRDLPRGRFSFPGLYCPGLIEAGRRATIRTRWNCFRGSIAPASLKRRQERLPALAHVAFPGLYCPGLIEALISGALGALSGGVSGALLPRPH